MHQSVAVGVIFRSMGGWRQRFRKGLECRAVKTKKKSHVCITESVVFALAVALISF